MELNNNKNKPPEGHKCKLRAVSVKLERYHPYTNRSDRAPVPLVTNLRTVRVPLERCDGLTGRQKIVMAPNNHKYKPQNLHECKLRAVSVKLERYHPYTRGKNGASRPMATSTQTVQNALKKDDRPTECKERNTCGNLNQKGNLYRKTLSLILDRCDITQLKDKNPSKSSKSHTPTKESAELTSDITIITKLTNTPLSAPTRLTNHKNTMGVRVLQLNMARSAVVTGEVRQLVSEN